MDIKISDLLTAAGVTGLPGRTEGSPERVREAVAKGTLWALRDEFYARYDMSRTF